MMAHIHPPQAANAQGNTPFTVSNTLSRLAIGGVVAGAAIMLAPHILPALGIGSTAIAEESMWVLHTSAEAGGSGLAGTVSNLLSSVPVIGPKLAEGGLFNAAVTGVIGVGGVLLGNFVEKREGNSFLKLGKMIKYAALATSAIIALPTVLTAIGSGLIYLSTLIGNASFTNSVVNFVGSTLGTMGGAGHSMMGFSGVAAVIPHLLTCGVAILPAATMAYTSSGDSAGSSPAQKYTDGSILVSVHPDKPLQANVPCIATIRLAHRHTGQPLTAEELAITHTEKLHMLLVDSSLRDYQHIHPRPTGVPGEFQCSFTPRTSNNYSAWADFTLVKDSQNHRIKSELASQARRDIRPAIRPNNEVEDGGLRFEWQSEPLRHGEDSLVHVFITDNSGRPVTDLEPVMGAFAHLVGFSADGQSIIHTHPLGREPAHAGERGTGHLRFHVEPDCTGDTQFYLQVKREGKDLYVPFGQRIQTPEQATQRVRVSQAHHAAHAQAAGI